MRHIILGTAGHIDHGKSSLVKALTGIDPDRLKEEKERGITIDIGFADLAFPDSGLTIGIVDVPGHEKLISNMLAGAGGIDMVLLVIAADEGIMPQSREHLAICNLLKIRSGLIAITKADLVEKDWLDLVSDDIKSLTKGTFLEGSPVIAVSSKSGENLELLKSTIKETALNTSQKTSEGLFRLPIDRVFTLKGFGTVITGTAISGSISVDNPLEILPRNINTKVRGLHSHGRSITTAYAGQRVAINLQAIEKEDLKRGDVAVTPSSFRSVKTLDVHLELLKEVPTLKDRSLVHFYVGTSETIARAIIYEKEELKTGEQGYCQLRLKNSVIAVAGDRYIIRRFSPLETLGGGEILDPSPHKRKRKQGIEDLRILHNGTIEEKISLKIEKSGVQGISFDKIKSWIMADHGIISETVNTLSKKEEIIRYGDIYLHKKAQESLNRKIVDLLNAYHKSNPLKPGLPKEEVRNRLKLEPKLFNLLIASFKDITAEKNIMRLKDFKIELSSGQEVHKTKMLDLLKTSGFQPPAKSELSSLLGIDSKQTSDILNILSKDGRIVRINDTLYISSASYERIISLLKSFFAEKSEMTVAEFRDMLNTSRKYALPYLEYLDSHNVTIRTGDVRKLLLKNT
jgi:selenocysteine-specific elongation factor